MKLLHTADWHLGKRLYDRSRLEEQQEVLEALCTLADEEEVDAVLIAGDLFDSFNPSNEAAELFYRTIHRLAKNGQRAVVAIAGNHDSADRIEAPNPLARACGILMAGYPHTEMPTFALDAGLVVQQSAPGFVELLLPKYAYPLRILTTPYANEARLRQFLGTDNPEASLQQALEDRWSALAEQYCNNEGVNVLMAHLFMAANADSVQAEPEDEKPILHVGGAQVVYANSIPNAIQYTALGHLHRCHAVGGKSAPVVYSGSLLEYSFSEVRQEKYAVLIEVEPGAEAKWSKVALPLTRRLHRKRFDNTDAAVQWLQENPKAYIELTMVSNTFLDGATKRRLHQAHEGIMAIIPEVKQAKAKEEGGAIDMTQDVATLFRQYFQEKHGQEMPEGLMDIFKEILAKQ